MQITGPVIESCKILLSLQFWDPFIVNSTLFPEAAFSIKGLTLAKTCGGIKYIQPFATTI
jgi:hypothetical protein